MVEITLPIVLQILQTAGILVGIIYYITIMRNSQRNQELAIKAQDQATETRQFQTFMQLAEYERSGEGWRDHLEWTNMEWDDYDDFERKYGSDVNPENYIRRQRKISFYDRVGWLLKYGMIDKNIAYELGGTGYISNWNKYKEIIKIQRELYNIPDYCAHWEYLYEQMAKIAEERGFDSTSVINISYSDEVRKKTT